jgi:putative spermidine/putrescine transport system permease protein
MLAPVVATVVLLFGGGHAGAIRQSLHPTIDGAGPPDPSAWTTVLHDPAFQPSPTRSGSACVPPCWPPACRPWRPSRSPWSCAATAPCPGSWPRCPSPCRTCSSPPSPWRGPGGLAERALGALPLELVRDRAGLGVVLVYLYKETPFLVLLLLASMGPGLAQREEAAAVLGATRWQRLRWVVWPTIRTPLASGALIVAAFVLGAFEVPLTVGPNYPPTLATYAADQPQLDQRLGDLEDMARTMGLGTPRRPALVTLPAIRPTLGAAVSCV